MRIVVTIRELMDYGVWDDYCEKVGWDVWCVKNGRADSSEEVSLDKETAMQYGFIERPCYYR